MSYLNLESILRRLRSGVSNLTPGEIRSLINYLVETTDELNKQVESLRRSVSPGSLEKEDSGDRVRRGRKPKQDTREVSETSGNA